MAVTHVTHTVAGFSAINYALSGKPHVADKYVSGRVLTASGVNCTVHGCRTQMNAVWKRYGINRPTKHKRRQAQRVIQSFDPNQLDYRKPEDIRKVNAIGVRTARKLYPHRQSIVVTQADNEHHVLHNHIITNMLDFRTGHSMNGKYTSWRHVQTVSDDVVRGYGLNPEAHKLMISTAHGRVPTGYIHETNAEYHLRKNGRYSWVHDIRSRVYQAMAHSASWSELITKCRQQGVTCDPFRKHKGGVRRDKNGDPVLKAHTSYRFTDKNGKSHRIRDKKLGEIFIKPAAVARFQTVASVRQKRQKSSLERQSANVSLANQQKARASENASIRASSASASASVSASISASVSASTSPRTSVSASFSFDPVSQRNQLASEAYSSVATSFSSEMGTISQQSTKALSEAQNIRTDSTVGSTLLEWRAFKQAQKINEDDEVQRVGAIMPKFSSKWVQRYAYWNYQHAIPAYCVGYNSRHIPRFKVARHDQSYIDKLCEPIKNGFRKGKRWTLSKWNAGKKSIHRFLIQHKVQLSTTSYVDKAGFPVRKGDPRGHAVTYPIDIEDMAMSFKHSILRGYHSTAKRFSDDWGMISAKFNDSVVRPVLAKFDDLSGRASSASSVSASVSNHRDYVITTADLSADDAASLAQSSRRLQNARIFSESSSASYSSWASTPSGSASIASSASRSAASSSAAVSSASVSVSASASQWTSSAYGLNYFGWSSAISSAVDFAGTSSGNWGSFSSLVSIGNHKQALFSGAYGYQQKPRAVNFNQYSSLTYSCKSSSQSVSQSIARGQSGGGIQSA